MYLAAVLVPAFPGVSVVVGDLVELVRRSLKENCVLFHGGGL